MNPKLVIAYAIAVTVVLWGAWYWFVFPHPQKSDAPQTEQATSTSGVEYEPGNLLLGVDSNATLGKYLIASNAMTLYVYTNDTPGVSNCSGTCAVNWPPYIVRSRDVLANVQMGISGKVDATTRADGSMQVTYNGAPLYFWHGDAVSGDTKGQGIGGVWYVVAP